MSIRTSVACGAAVLVLLGAVACSSTKQIPLDPTGAPEATGASPLPGQTVAPGDPNDPNEPPKEGNGTPPAEDEPAVAADPTGTAKTEVTVTGGSNSPEGGATTFSLDFPTIGAYSFYTGPEGLSSISFVTLDGNASLLLGGYFHKGSQKTSSDASLQIRVNDPVVIFGSGDGSCRVNVKVATDTRFAGSYKCEDVPMNNKQNITLQGTFDTAIPEEALV